MARKRKDEQLTLSQIANIRATHAKRASNLLARLGKFADGELKSPQGQPVDMSANQVKAASLVIAAVLPAQQSTTVQEIAPKQDPESLKEEIRELRQQVIDSLTPEEILNVTNEIH